MGLTDDSGTISDQYQYDAWGGMAFLPNPPPNNTYNPYHYTGQQVDSSINLYYLRNRYYDAQAGRFITQDPIGFKGGLNFYAYVGNNPVNFYDPSGLYFLGKSLKIALKEWDYVVGESTFKQAIRQVYSALNAKSQNGVLGMSGDLTKILNEPKFIIDFGINPKEPNTTGFMLRSENIGIPDPVFGFTGKIYITQFGIDNTLGYGMNEIILHELLHVYVTRLGLKFASQKAEEAWIESLVTYYFPNRLVLADLSKYSRGGIDYTPAMIPTGGEPSDPESLLEWILKVLEHAKLK